MMSSRRRTVVLERTLHAKAAQATDATTAAGTAAVAAPAFDPTRRPVTAERAGRLAAASPREPGPGTGPDDDDARRRPSSGRDDRDAVDDTNAPIPLTGRTHAGGRRRRLLVPVAACLAVVALIAGALAIDGGIGGDGGDDVAVSPLTIGDPPDGWLVPAWLPEGMTLLGVDAVTLDQTDIAPSGTIPQLFGDPEGGRAIYITSGYEINAETIEDVAVRGTTSSAGMGWGVAEEDLGDAVRWDERGVSITALYRGVTRDGAIAMLDALEWRSDDPLDGFAPPADEAWPLRAEATSRDTVDRSASLIYRDAAAPVADPYDGQLYVSTSSSSTVTAGYLETWYLEGEGDGTGPLVTRRNDGQDVHVYWPDGRSASVLGPRSGEFGADVLERIAGSVTLADEADVAALRTSLGTRIAGLTPVATADTSIGAIDVQDDSGFLRLCLRQAGGPAANCNTSATAIGGSGSSGQAMASADWTVDGTWYVAVATRGDAPGIFGARRDQVISPESGELPTETVVVGEWTVRLVAPAPDIDGVCTGDEAAMACLHSRPE